MENQNEQLRGIVNDFNQNQGQVSQNFQQMQQMPQTEVKYAGFWIRYAAAFIDGIIVNVASTAVGFVFGIILLGAKFGGYDSKNAVNFLGYFGYLLGFIITWAYYIFMTHKYQATLGKMAVGVKVVAQDGERVGLGKLVLRETIGKILSVVTLGIGYIVAAFHPQKKALHDHMAGTVVIYKDPNKKANGWIIGVIVAVVVLAMMAIIGILASIVLVSLNSAREKASDAAIKATITGAMPDAIIRLADEGTLAGYSPSIIYSENIKKCSGDPIVNISPNGQDLAVFAKLCSDDKKYFCNDISSNAQEVDVIYATGRNYVCPGTKATAEDFSENAIGKKEASAEASVDANGLSADAANDVAMINVATEIAKKWQSDAQPHIVFMFSSGEIDNEHAVIFKSKSKPGKVYTVYLDFNNKITESIEETDQFPEAGYMDVSSIKISSAKAFQIASGKVAGKLKGELGDYQTVFALMYIKEAKDNVWLYTLTNKKNANDVVHVFVTGALGEVRSSLE